MRPQPIVRRMAVRSRPRSRPNNSSSLPRHRTFTARTSTLTSSRPYLPFLGIPASSRHQFRYLTTERKAWIMSQTRLAFRWTFVGWSMIAAISGIVFAISQESQERKHPTPHEWSFKSRLGLRGALCELNRNDGKRVDYVMLTELLMNLVKRLENQAIDGKGLVPLQKELADLEDDFQGYDISGMSENWRRGYHEALLTLAKVSEHVDGFVNDRTRNIVFPPELVIGPSNPRPKPIPPGSPSAPREEDCDIPFPRTDEFYAKLGRIRGFSPRQEVENALAFANWEEYKGDHEAAEKQLAIALAAAEKQIGVEASTSKADVKKSLQSWVANDTTTPSELILMVRSAIATFYARKGDMDAAVPMLVSLLKTRRSLPNSSAAVASQASPTKLADQTPKSLRQTIIGTVKGVVIEPDYPPPPPDGASPPVRDAKELCEEAALQLHIGEVMYATSKGANASREEGLAWTREAIDVAEEQLHRLGKPTATKNDPAAPARSTCRQCLGAGLDNWAEMVGRLAREEEERKKKAQNEGEGKASAGWFGFWGDGKVEDTGRWSAEEKVVKERTRRAKDLLEELTPPSKGIMSLFYA